MCRDFFNSKNMAKFAPRKFIHTSKNKRMKNKTLPSPLLSLLPIAVLVAMLGVTIYLFGSDALGGGSQVCLDWDARIPTQVEAFRKSNNP